ncbi:MAG: SDR family oxidoreductase [Pleurocapsa sp. SU_196_0]|nr:SDR family oxidoreductase [Pleurocapsa sp. SU_196_0]
MSIEGSGGLHVILTGASSGIGEATARALAGAGHRLVLAARRTELLEKLVQDLNPSGKRVIGVVCDVTKPEDLENLVARARSEFGPVQVLVNNAGVDSGGQKWWLADSSEIHKVLHTNLTAVFELTRLVLPEMLEEKNGHVVNIGSVAGRMAVSSLYSASKFGVRGFSLSLRRELLGTGVNVSLVAPGFIRTAMTSKGGKRPLPMPGPEVIASAVLNLLETPKAEVIVPGYYRLLCWLETLLPVLGDAVVQRSWKKE